IGSRDALGPGASAGLRYGVLPFSCEASSVVRVVKVASQQASSSLRISWVTSGSLPRPRGRALRSRLLPLALSRIFDLPAVPPLRVTLKTPSPPALLSLYF